jgi:hypothetical protein
MCNYGRAGARGGGRKAKLPSLKSSKAPNRFTQTLVRDNSRSSRRREPPSPRCACGVLRTCAGGVLHGLSIAVDSVAGTSSLNHWHAIPWSTSVFFPSRRNLSAFAEPRGGGEALLHEAYLLDLSLDVIACMEPLMVASRLLYGFMTCLAVVPSSGVKVFV